MVEVDINDNRTIRVHRGDKGILTYTIPMSDTENYKFQRGDIVEFTVFEKNGYNKTPVLDKRIEIIEETETVDIILTEQDTTIKEPSNKVVVYWYEISLNGNQTSIGYDEEEGAAEFRILPAKGYEE